MNVIDSLTIDDAYPSVKLDRINHEIFGRLFNETYLLRELSWHQLNIEKNKSKPNFSDLPLEDIINGLHEELDELTVELKKELDFKRIYEELGDLGGYLSGLIEWLLQEQKKLRRL